LCDKAREVCPTFDHAVRTHWSIPEPVSYPHMAAAIDTRVRHLLPVIANQEVLS
jgi:hypothetical protein